MEMLRNSSHSGSSHGCGLQYLVGRRTPAELALMWNKVEAKKLLDSWRERSQVIYTLTYAYVSLQKIHFPIHLRISTIIKGAYIDGKDGIMLVKTASLRKFLERKDMTSEDILETFWKKDGNIYKLLPRDCFIWVTWDELKDCRYAVLSYQWKSPWQTLVNFILHGERRVHLYYMWIDVLCLDQMSQDKMETIRRSNEIYLNAKEYHLMEIGSLLRGWVLFELSSVKETMLPPVTHYTAKDPAMIQTVKDRLRSTGSDGGFEGSKFSDETDRPKVRQHIIDTPIYGTVAKFNEKIITIVDNIPAFLN